MKKLNQLSITLGIPFYPADNRSTASDLRQKIFEISKQNMTFNVTNVVDPIPQISLVDQPSWTKRLFKLKLEIALLLMILPICLTLFGANELAGILDPIVAAYLQPLIEVLKI